MYGETYCAECAGILTAQIERISKAQIEMSIALISNAVYADCWDIYCADVYCGDGEYFSFAE